jgi:glutaryl-CoA dehydrogenase
MSDTNYVDFYGIDSLLTEDERKVRDAVRTFVDHDCMPIIAEHFDKGSFPMEMIPRMASMELFIDLKNCEIPQTNILPTAHGLKSVFQCLNHARYGVACGALGASVACYQTARDFAVKRQVFDRPVASYQLVQDQLARMLIEITKAQLVCFRLGRMLDDNQVIPPQISLAKLNNVREAMKIARLARDITGARGILADHHVIRHLCDLEAISTLEGTAGMHTLVLGQDITGIAAFH